MKTSKYKKLGDDAFSHLEIVMLVAVVAIVFGVSLFVLKGQVAHAGSWTQLSLDKAKTVTTAESQGIAAEACQTVVASQYATQIDITDSNTLSGYIGYDVYKSTGTTLTKIASSYQTTATSGHNLKKTITLISGEYLTIAVNNNAGTTNYGYLYNPSQKLAASSTTHPSVAVPLWYILPAQLGSCPAVTPPPHSSTTSTGSPPPPPQPSNTGNQNSNGGGQSNTGSASGYSTTGSSSGSASATTGSTTDFSSQTGSFSGSSTSSTSSSNGTGNKKQSANEYINNLIRGKKSRPNTSFWHRFITDIKNIF